MANTVAVGTGQRYDMLLYTSDIEQTASELIDSPVVAIDAETTVEEACDVRQYNLR